jgi:hypothetical protein
MYISGGILLNSPDNSIINKYAIKIESGSGAIWANNINVGYPTSNAWQTNLNGSYFNNFNPNTDVSEILRFVAGLLSSSAPAPSPNTKAYGNITSTVVNPGTSTIAAGSIPSGSTNDTILYLQGKGFANSGSTIFPGITIQTNYTYGYTYSSVFSGSTTVSSSTDTQLFGLGTIIDANTPNTFYVSGSITWRYSNNSSKINTATSSSQALLSNSTFGTANGLTIGKINTSNPAVIPSTYQDGKFATIFQSTLWSGSEGTGGATGSGYYQISASIAIASGSSTYSLFRTSSAEIFWAPVATINATIPINTVTIGSPVATISGSLTAVSRSLSGAPYLTNATYYISSSINGIFDPLYQAAGGVASITSTGVAGLSNSTSTLSTAGGTIQTANTVYDSTNTVVRATATIPAQSDIVRLSSLATFTPSGITNIASSTISPTTFTFTITGKNRTGGSTTSSPTLAYHTAGDFGQPAASGSMAYYGRAQGYDGSTYTLTGAGTVTANFTGENQRLQITDKLLSGSYSLGDAWNTTYQVYNLTSNDLQIKPGASTGFLVKPGGTYGYWLPDPGASTYKYAAFAFYRNIGTNQASTTLSYTGGSTPIPWSSTSDGIAMLIIPQSVLGSGATTAAGIDPQAASGYTLNVGDAQNPFGRNLQILANGGTFPTINFPTVPAYPLNTTYRNFVVLIRYKGDPAPLTSISFSITA